MKKLFVFAFFMTVLLSILIMPFAASANGTIGTPGFWKNHSDSSKKQYMPTWDEIGGPGTDFFDGQSWIEVLNTPPAGNPYYILAHQYIAACLNLTHLDGASALSSMEALTASLSIEDIVEHAGLLLQNSVDSPLLEQSSLDSAELELVKAAVRQDFITTAYILDQFNNSFVIREDDD